MTNPFQVKEALGKQERVLTALNRIRRLSKLYLHSVYFQFTKSEADIQVRLLRPQAAVVAS